MKNIIHTKNYYFDENQIKIIEEKYNVKYIGDFDFLLSDNVYSDTPASLFYSENPDLAKGHSHYLAVRPTDKKGIISLFNGIRCTRDPLSAIKDFEGNYLLSTYRHDYRSDGYNYVDGGRSYRRISKDADFYEVIFLKDKLILL